MADAAPEPLEAASTTGALPVAPSLGPALPASARARRAGPMDAAALRVAGLAALVAVGAALGAQVLTRLIDLVTNVAFFGRISLEPASPANAHLGAWVLVVPVLGGLVVGAMARYGSAAIRGHGIPEAMERVLRHESRIPARLTWLKPLSAAVAIGTGGPFGAEGPIIATGGALGSLVGQLVHVTPRERRALLAAGAAAGMAATFGSPISAVLLAIELLVFELSPQTLVPVALASAIATGVRLAFGGVEAPFAMPAIGVPTSSALASYLALGAIVGVASVYVTRAVYAVEEAFEKLPVHWAFWPAIGAFAVGFVGWFAPHVLGVGYDNIQHLVRGELALRVVAVLCIAKFIAWVIALGSGTSGGTLAPLFTVGGALGAVLGAAAVAVLPGAGVDPRVAALVGMAAMFAGASRALLASIVFAFETTRQPMVLLPLLGGCTAAYVVSWVMMRHSIMTAKIADRGVVVPVVYTPDPLAATPVLEIATRDVVALDADESVGRARERVLASGRAQPAFPVVAAPGAVVGFVTARELRGATASTDVPVRGLVARRPVVVGDEDVVADAVLAMLEDDVGRVPVVAPDGALVAILTRSDVLRAYEAHLAQDRRTARASLE